MSENSNVTAGVEAGNKARKGIDYKWIALSNVTLASLMGSVNGSIILISLPAIFKGIRLDPMAPDAFQYLLWILMGYGLVTATLLLSIGRLIDILGNLIFIAGLSSLLIGITYGLMPYGTDSMGWNSPWVIGAMILGIGLLIAFPFVERRAKNPMFRFDLFRIRSFAYANLASFTSAIARGGAMFMLILLLHGIWLPLHGYAYADTPFWAGVYMIPMTIGFIIMGPISGILSDKYGPRWIATGGMPASVVDTIPHDIIATLEGSTWFPRTLADAFMPSLRLSFLIGAMLSGIAAVLSAMRGQRYVHDIHGPANGVKVAATIKAEEKK